MKVELISVTAPQIRADPTCEDYTPDTSPEELIVYCARVSSPQNQTNALTAPRLLRYLVEHRHWSPFEMVDMCVEVETSRAIAAQILRHWSLSFQEFSQRYAQASLGFEIYPARLQGEKNRQAGGAPDEVPYTLACWWDDAQREHYAACEKLYEEALRRGIARELARMLLPLATRTRLYIKGSVRDWIFYLQARTAPDAQFEHREIAAAILPIFRELFPNTAEAIFGTVD
jgi:thymidylate synthase (FAD)